MRGKEVCTERAVQVDEHGCVMEVDVDRLSLSNDTNTHRDVF